MRVLFGGSFDPVHHGHIAVATYLRDLGAKVLMLISVNPPFRGAPRASTEHRMAMLRLALDVNTADNADKDFRIDRGDSVCESPYTIDVLQSLRGCLGEASPLACALGSDQYAKLNTWRDWRRLTELAHLIVFPRLGQAAHTHAEVSQRMDACQCTIDRLFNLPCGCVAEAASVPPQVSSTDIRNRLKQGEGVSGMLPESVLDYIRSQGLYRTVEA